MPKVELTPEARGYDKAIDSVVVELNRQLKALQKELGKAAGSFDKHALTYAISLYKNLIVQIKQAKGDPGSQVFTGDEVRAIVDHVTGSCQSVNNSTMSWFDTHFIAGYIAGEIQLKEFTKPKTES